MEPHDSTDPTADSWHPPDGSRPTFLSPEDIPQWPRLPADADPPEAPQWPGGDLPPGYGQPAWTAYLSDHEPAASAWAPLADTPPGGHSAGPNGGPATPPRDDPGLHSAAPEPGYRLPQYGAGQPVTQDEPGRPAAPWPGHTRPHDGYGQPAVPGPGYTVPGYPGWVWDGRQWVPARVRRGPWAVPVEDGTPYLRLGRNAAHRWWRPLAGTLALAGLALGVMLMLVLVWGLVHWAVTGEEPFANDDALFGGVIEDLAVQLVTLGVVLPIVLFVTWGVGRRPAGTVISVLGRMRWRWLAACMGAGLGFVVVSYALNLAVSAVYTPDEQGEDFIGWGAFWAPALMIVLLVPFQSAAEEFVFRGWLLQAVGAYRALRTPLPAMLISSALFVLGHGYRGWAMLDIFVFAMIAAWLVVRTGGLEASIALHVLNNLMAFLLPAATGALDDTLVQGSAPWYVLLVDIPPLLLYALGVLYLTRRSKIATVSGER